MMWIKWYDKILDDFGFSMYDDVKSANVLNNLIEKKGKYDIKDISIKDKCIIFGAGPSLDKNIHQIKDSFDIEEYIIIAADGATTALLKQNIIPTIIVTDLDGDMDNIIKANKSGSILYVHAHGDNINKIKKYIPLLKNIIPTTQAKKHDLLENYGGFTDGDRAIYIAYYGLHIKNILLAGMDFGKKVTKYSRPDITSDINDATPFKIKKLEYAKKLTEEIAYLNKDLKIYNISENKLENIEDIII